MSTFGSVDLFCPFCGAPFRYDVTGKVYFHSSEWGVLCSKACFDAGQRAYARMILGQDSLREDKVKVGDVVMVYPLGSPKQKARATVLTFASSGTAIAVAFDDKPPFVVDKSGGMMVHRDLGQIVMMATRELLNGQPWGPWIELVGKGMYEIEEGAR